MKIAREKETIIAIMVGCLVLYSLFSRPLLWQVALAVGIIGILSDKISRWIHVAWFSLAKVVGYVVSRIILGALFLTILLP